MYYRNAHAAIVVFDVTNPQSFERAQKWIAELLEKAYSGIIIALCGNKVDLDESRRVSSEEAKKYAEQIGSFYIEVSAKINLNIEKLFEEVGEKLPQIVISNKLIDKNSDDLNNQKREQNCSYC
jgi:Ras-related protein Rab-5C